MTTQARDEALDGAMLDIQERAERFGGASLKDGILYFGSTAIPKPDFEIVTKVHSDFGGAASIFVARGEGFVQAATSIFREHTRALDTDLDWSGPAIGSLRAGLSYRGAADILGEACDSYYEPIADNDGAVIGAFLVAFPRES